MISNSSANYAGRQPNSTAYIKTFYPAGLSDLWTTTNYNTTNKIPNVLTIANKTIQSILIPGNIYLGGTVYNYSDIQLKNNINKIELDTSQHLSNLNPVSYCFKNDPNKLHYGLIAQEVESLVKNTVEIKPGYGFNDFHYLNTDQIHYIHMATTEYLIEKMSTQQSTIDGLLAEI